MSVQPFYTNVKYGKFQSIICNVGIIIWEGGKDIFILASKHIQDDFYNIIHSFWETITKTAMRSL